VDKLTRKQLKSDKFALEVQHSVEFVADHRRQMMRWGGVGVAVLAIILGVYLYLQHQHSVREEALAAAFRIQNATIGQAQNEYALAFPTDEERSKAADKAFTDIAARFPGTDEGIVAEFFLGSNAADKGLLPEAKKRFQLVADAGKPYSTLAKLSLAQVCAAEGNLTEAQKQIQSVIDNPNTLVSKESAIIAMARLIGPTKPQEARKLLEPLRGNTRPAVSQASLSALGELSQK
jgi:TolA-binding protein